MKKKAIPVGVVEQKVPHTLSKTMFLGREIFTCSGCGRLYRDRGHAGRDTSCPKTQMNLFVKS